MVITSCREDRQRVKAARKGQNGCCSVVIEGTAPEEREVAEFFRSLGYDVQVVTPGSMDPRLPFAGEA